MLADPVLRSRLSQWSNETELSRGERERARLALEVF
jgi:hypothetical protein